MQPFHPNMLIAKLLKLLQSFTTTPVSTSYQFLLFSLEITFEHKILRMKPWFYIFDQFSSHLITSGCWTLRMRPSNGLRRRAENCASWWGPRLLLLCSPSRSTPSCDPSGKTWKLQMEEKWRNSRRCNLRIASNFVLQVCQGNYTLWAPKTTTA